MPTNVRECGRAVVLGVALMFGCVHAVNAEPDEAPQPAPGAVQHVTPQRTAEAVNPAILAGTSLGRASKAVASEAAQPAQTFTTLRDRLTVSVLWGWDNQFSGKMIKEASGQTTGGVPINLTETTFDDVYGRMGIFKVGVGYRITPRTEAVVNLVISRSGAEEQVQVGTLGSANVPLNVHFEAYNYWGLEVGQRFFFTRVRFTPFVGYLLGINRFDDIRGTFVGVPAGVTPPGLAAQDGKFFEKSWAFSFGPTAGVLIGFSFLEFMAETQFRYMGGLSDVDWLVEEGLRDINSESSRWSLPLMVGVRVRF